MAELYPSDAELNALSGATDSEQEVLYVTTGESPYYISFYKMLQRLLKVARRAGDLRVFKDGDLTFGVRAGRYFNGDTAVNYSQVTAQALTNNATNYIYLTADGTLTVNTTGFPVPSVTPHIPLATIVTSAGAYDGRDASEGGDITDYRGRGFMSVCGEPPIESLQDLLPNLNITAGAEDTDVREITIQARDAANNNLAERVLVRVWIATSDYGAPSATGNTVSVGTGTTYETETANAAYKIISNADGAVVFDVQISGAATRYIMAEIDGRIYSSGAVEWAA